MSVTSQIEVQLIPLERFAEPKFDLSQLPFAITLGVEAADVSTMMPSADFAYLELEVGRYQMRNFNAAAKFGLVHRYVLQIPDDNDANKEKETLLNNIFALLRIIRPHRRLGGASGTITNGKVQFDSVVWPESAIDVPEAVKLFSIRNKDLVEVRNLFPTFVKSNARPLLAVSHGRPVLLHGIRAERLESALPVMGIFCASRSVLAQGQQNNPQS